MAADSAATHAGPQWTRSLSFQALITPFPVRDTIALSPGSKIREVANAGIGRDDVLAFWFGESDEVTPEPVRSAAARSLQDGETFYGHNLGLLELRQALADYCSSLHGAVDVERSPSPVRRQRADAGDATAGRCR